MTKVTNKTLVISVAVVVAIAALVAVAAQPGSHGRGWHPGPPGLRLGAPPMLMMGGPAGPPEAGRGRPDRQPAGGPPPRGAAPTMVAYNGVIYIAAGGKVTALDAKTLKQVAAGSYGEGPGRGPR